MAKIKFTVSTAPFLKDQVSTPKIMFEVVYTLIPVVAVAFYYFGLSALLQTVTGIVSCLFTEWLFDPNRPKGKSLRDGSALITGILLALTLPPGFPLWMTFLGGVVSIGMGKLIWGGLGQNIFNPALVGRAFLQAAFPTAITTWSPPDGEWFMPRPGNLAFPFSHPAAPDGMTMATPLAKMKFEHAATSLHDLLLGNTGGSLGETCGLILILAGIYLLARGIINWRVPASILLSVGILSGIIYWASPETYPAPWFMLLSGGLLLGTVYMATDLVTSPITPRGLWIYGAGIGILVVLIRIWGGLPEGVMYAILLMNAATPLINRFTKIKPYGRRKKLKTDD